MSRVKSSRSVVTGMVLTRQYNANGYPPGPVADFIRRDWLAGEFDIVPDVKRNPKQFDGFRQPSDYSMQKEVAYPNNTRVPVKGFLVRAESPRRETRQQQRFGHALLTSEGSVCFRVTATPVDTWALRQQLRMRILNNIKDEKLNVAMVLAEIGKTANTASNLLLRIGRSMDAIRRRKPETFNWLMHGRMGVDNRRPTDKFLREAASTFLEWKYGIMPSVYDLESATKSLDVINDGSLFDRPPLMVARSRVSRVDNVDLRYSLEQLFSSVYSGSGTTKTTISGVAYFTVHGEAMRGLSEYGIGLTSVATVAYDLTPFSFVANMAIPMAELISAWGALAGVTVRGYSETEYVEHTFPARTITDSYQQYKDIPFRMEATKGTTFRRSGSNTVPFPVPFIRNPVKVGNLSTVLALFTQMRNKPKREPRLYGFDSKDL